MRKRIKLAGIYPLIALVLFPVGAAAEEFFYKQEAGDKYRILSTVREDVYIDYKLSHRAEILNRVAVEVTDSANGAGFHKVVFQTSERALASGGARGAAPGGRSFQWSREYESEFERDRLGYLSIDRKYFMPVVRNVPVFPGRDLKPGEQWSAEGHETHDFRDSFGINEPYRIPFTAQYEFLGDRHWKGKTWPAFSVSYRILSEPVAVSGRVWPRRIIGASDQTVYWDSGLGQPAAYEEQFRMVFTLSNGRTVEYRGRAEAEIIEAEEMDKEKIAGEIAEDLNRLNVPDASVRVVEEGITISLEDIRFQADTAVMLPGEREKLDKIAGILKRYPERDILVGGHSALAGSEEGRMRLSLERASVVADYLVAQQARGTDRVVVRGYGAERPLADNRTEDGRRKNRRVEITILEN
jgi:outer membrane protein OmpA-like peptidoglycan-associated protein